MQFDVSFDAANSPDLGQLTSQERQAVLDTMQAAATIWSWYLTAANITLDISISVDDSLYSGNVVAIGGPGELVSTGTTFNGKTVYEPIAAKKLRTGQDENASDADLHIGLTVSAIRNLLFYKTENYAAVPSGRVDALSVFMHEIGHGLGFLSVADEPGFPGTSVYDTLIQNDKFSGANTVAAYQRLESGATMVPLEHGSLSHLREIGALWLDLMSPIIGWGENAHISDIDLAVLQDIGVPIRLPTSGDDVLHALSGLELNLGAGNDTGYALDGGSFIRGGAGNDWLIGGMAQDVLVGDEGEDDFQGNGGNDTLTGGAGTDTAHYSGRASDYRITGTVRSVLYVTDLRSGSPDGADALYDIEKIQWGDGSYADLNDAPVVTTGPVTGHKGQSISVMSLFRVTDTEGDPVTLYQLWDSNRDPASGYFVVDGAVQAAGTVITVTPDQLTRTFFVVGTLNDELQIRAFAGGRWSAADTAAWSPFTVYGLVNDAPTVTGGISSLANQMLDASSLFSVSDLNGDVITRYQFQDRTGDTNSGYFVVDGVIKAAGDIIDVNAAQLAQVKFVSGSAVGDSIQIRAFDGTDWSDPADWAAGIYSGGSAFGVSLSGPLNHRPELTLGDRRSGSFYGPLGAFAAQRNEVLSPSVFSFTYDADGNSITKYQLLDSTADPASGHWVVNGVVKAAGTIIELTPAELSQTVFVTGTVGDTLQMRAFDGTNWSASPLAGYVWTISEVAWASLAVSVPNTVPVVAPQDVAWAPSQSIQLSQLFSVTDTDGDAITKYQLVDSTVDGRSGYFVINGSAQAQGAVVEITAAQLAQTSFVTGTIGDRLGVRAFDGNGWSAPEGIAWTSISVANHAPVVTTSSLSRGHDRTLALSSLFSVGDADGHAITKYQLWDSNREATSGYFTLNGARLAAGKVVEFGAADLANVRFVTGATGDNLQIRAFDGYDWSAGDNAAWAPFTVAIPPNHAPVVATSNLARRHGQALALSSLFSVSDADSDAITKYQLWDAGRGANSGYFTIGGVRQAAGTVIEVTAAQLATTSFVTGEIGDALQIRAFDGYDWSAGDNDAWAPFTVSVPANHAPGLTTGNLARGHGQTLALSSLFSVSDADSDTITKYQLWDAGREANSGYFTVGGVKQAAGTVIEVTAAQLATTSFVTGEIGDSLQIRAFEGYAWSAGDNEAWAPFIITVPANHAPVLTSGNLARGHGQTLALSSLFSVSDADSDTMTRYQLWDAGREANSGYFTVGGVKQAAGTVIEVTAAQLAATSFVTGEIGDNLQIRAFDGYGWSAGDNDAWAPFAVTVPTNHAPVVATADLSRTPGQTLALSSLFSVSDADADSMTRFQLWDSSREATSGHFVVDGVSQAAGSVIDISAAQLATTSFVTGTTGDNLQIRAFDGYAWSAGDNAAWAPFAITVPANHAPVLTTGNLARTPGQTLALSSLFSVSDADADSMTRFQLWDSSREPTSGHFVVDGVSQAAGSVIDISAAQLATTSFVTGTTGDNLQIRAFDGYAWSAGDNAAWSPFHIAT